MGSVTVIGVCVVAYTLYERGDGWDSLFLLFFSLTQHNETSSKRVFARLFLPTLALLQYLFKNAGSTSHSPPRFSQMRSPPSISGGSLQGSSTENALKSPLNGKWKAFPDESPASSPDGDGSTRNSSSSSSQKRGKRGSSTKKKQSSKLRGSVALSRRVLTLAMHVNILYTTVRYSPEGINFGDDVELVVILALVAFIFSLPSFPGIAIICIFGLNYTFRYALGRYWSSVAVPLFGFAFSVLGDALMAALQWVGIDAPQCAEILGNSSILLKAQQLLQACPGANDAIHAWNGFCDNHEGMYALLFLAEPWVVELFVWLCNRLRIDVRDVVAPPPPLLRSDRSISD